MTGTIIEEVDHFIQTELNELKRRKIPIEPLNHVQDWTGRKALELFIRTKEYVASIDTIVLEAESLENVKFLIKRKQEKHEEFIIDSYRKYLGKIEGIIAEWIPHLHNRNIQEVVIVLERLKDLVLRCFIQTYVDQETKQINLSREVLHSLITRHRPQDIAKMITGLIVDRKIQFPFKKYYMGNPKTMFENLKHFVMEEDRSPYTPQNIRFESKMFDFNFEGGPLVFVSKKEDYDSMDVIADFFQEEQRLKAKRQDQEMTAWDSWYNYEFCFKNLILPLINPNNLTPITTSELREKLYQTVKECTQFKPSLYLTFIRLFKSKRVLDFSAGWGDRLIGAMASEVDFYVGVDPNTDLKKGHDEMIKQLGALVTPNELPIDQRFRIIYAPFQTAEIPKELRFDLVSTSPPFFDFEIYTQNPGQSVLDHPRYEDWMVNFLFFSLEKGWDLLDINGYMAIHLTDVYKTKVCEAMSLFVQSKLEGSRRCGIISSTGQASKPRPIWIWQKVEKTDIEKAELATKELERLYPDVAQQLKRNKKRKAED